MRSKRLFMHFTILAALSPLLGGCWDYVDIENRAPVMTLAVDFTQGPPGGQFLTTLEIPVARALAEVQGSAQQEEPKVVIEQAGTTLGQALTLVNQKLARRAVFQQMTAILVSDDVARKGIAAVADHALRHPGFNPAAWIYVTDRPAGAFLKATPQFQPLTALYLSDLAKQFPIAPYMARPKEIHTFKVQLQEGATLAPRLTVDEGEIRMNGAAVFSEGRLVGVLDRELARGTNWLLGDLKLTEIAVPCPNQPQGRVTLLVRHAGRSVDLSLDTQSAPKFRFALAATANIIDMNLCPIAPSQAGTRQALADTAAGEIEKMVLAAFEKAQEMQVDYLRLGELLRYTHPVLWKEIEWVKLFPAVEAQIEARLSILGTGRLDQSTLPGSDQEPVAGFIGMTDEVDA